MNSKPKQGFAATRVDVAHGFAAGTGSTPMVRALGDRAGEPLGNGRFRDIHELLNLVSPLQPGRTLCVI